MDFVKSSMRNMLLKRKRRGLRCPWPSDSEGVISDAKARKYDSFFLSLRSSTEEAAEL